MIRNTTSQDFDFIYDLYMHPQANPYLLYEVMDVVAFQPIFDDLLKQKVKYVYGNGEENIGMFKFIPLQYRTDHIAYLGGLAINPRFTGKGEGKKMMTEIIGLAVSQGMLRVELSVSVTNTRAIHLYEKVGFQKEGILRKYTHLKSEGRFVDEVLMSFIA